MVAPHVDLTVFDGQGLVATSLAGQAVFSGAVYAAVARAVDGIRTEPELVQAVALAEGADDLSELREAGGRAAPPVRGPGSVASVRRAVAGMIATAVLRWIVLEGASGLNESVLSIDTHAWQTRSHALAWRPQCPACGEPGPFEAS